MNCHYVISLGSPPPPWCLDHFLLRSYCDGGKSVLGTKFLLDHLKAGVVGLRYLWMTIIFSISASEYVRETPPPLRTVKAIKT